MSRFQIFFSFIYIGVLFFCIFARIESWPFSDYRVFKRNHHPKYLISHVPWLKLSDGEYFNPSTREFYFHIDRPYFDEALRMMDPQTLERYLTSIAESKRLEKLAKRMRRAGKVPVKFVAMKITFKQGKNKKWSPVYTPVKEYDIP